MVNGIKKFLTCPNAQVLDVLKIIDENKKGFAVVVDESEVVCGIVTDGDIRRAFIKGFKIDDSVNKLMQINFKSLNVESNTTDAIDIFKDEQIKFLPIVDKDGKIVNILTKEQLHSIMLLDIHSDMMFDFTELDDNIVNHELFQRPWGFYKTTVMNNYFQSKIISVIPGGQLSLQSHNHREEYWIVAHGTGRVQIDNSIIPVQCGSSIFIPKGAKHRLENTDEVESLIITEVQIGEYFGEDDIIRYEDIYGRV